ALIGRAAGCDVRLNVEGVQPLHCILAQGPAGLVLRDLNTPDGTIVNDDSVDYAELSDGDLIAIGPFRFRVALPPVRSAGEALDHEKDALRVQAAAVAAQQATLAEVESQLDQRRQILERQEKQLAHHLDERRQRLIELQDEVRTSREELQKQQTTFE